MTLATRSTDAASSPISTYGDAIAIERALSLDLYGIEVFGHNGRTRDITQQVCMYSTCNMPAICSGDGIAYRAHWDSGWPDTPCSGCAACFPIDGRSRAGYWARGMTTEQVIAHNARRAVEARAAHAFGRMVWRASRLHLARALDAGVRAICALAAIGQAIESALAPGEAIAGMLANAIGNWNMLVPGRWVRVTGKRGRAKAAHGMIGQITEIESDTFEQARPAEWRGSWRGSVSTTVSARVQTTDGIARWIPVSQCAPIVAPVLDVSAEEPAQARARAVAEKITIPLIPRKGLQAIAVLAHRKVGELEINPGDVVSVFWHRDDRIGVKLCSCERRCKHLVAWISGRAAVALYPDSYPVSALTIAACERIAFALESVGHGKFADRYMTAARELQE